MKTVLDAGLELVREIRERMEIDDEWSCSDPDGFRWWGYNLMQRVWAEPPHDSFGTKAQCVHAGTTILENVPDTEETRLVLSTLNTHADMSALVYSPDASTVSLHSTVYVHNDSLGWLTKLFGHAVALQAAKSSKSAEAFQQAFGGEIASSSHPTSGPRQTPDDMLDVIEEMYLPTGAEPCRYTTADFEQALQFSPRPWVLASGGKDGLVAEFAFSSDKPAMLASVLNEPIGTAMLQALVHTHPQLGSGLLLLLRLPCGFEEGEEMRLAQQLNEAESREWAATHFLGAWCMAPSGGLTFVSFLPSATYQPSLLINLLLSTYVRVKWVKKYLDNTM